LVAANHNCGEIQNGQPQECTRFHMLHNQTAQKQVLLFQPFGLLMQLDVENINNWKFVLQTSKLLLLLMEGHRHVAL